MSAEGRAVLAAAMAYYRAENACVAAQATYDLVGGAANYQLLRRREDERADALEALEGACAALDRAEKGMPR
ncbi:MAG TPA: hypothetical protein VFL91_21290 [Thermomicrobiales bacterium]|nr:hypothetical protein [Thermomicrobiales bacterium]